MRVRASIALGCIALLAVGAVSLPQLGRRDTAAAAGGSAGGCGSSCMWSSAGSADLHGFAHDDAGHQHAVFVDARWAPAALHRLQREAAAWRQTITIDLPPEAAAQPVVLEHWASDLPGARVEVVSSPGSITLAVTVRALRDLAAEQSYRTQAVLRFAEALEGQRWDYQEHLQRVHPTPDGRDGRFRADGSSSTRQGRNAWCSRCFVRWGAQAPGSG
jgi:hypothetical protein